MKYEKGIELVVNGAKGFHARLRKVYGMIALRLDDKSYLMTCENILLSNVKKEDITQYDITTGEIGKIFCARPDLNAFVFICTGDSVNVSKSGEPLLPSLDDMAQIIGPDAPVIDCVSSDLILSALKDRGGCLVKGSGIIGVGKNIQEAVAAVQIIEKSCEAEVLAEKIGGIKHLDPEVSLNLRDEYLTTYSIVNSDSKVNFIGYDEEEFQKRLALIEYGKKLCRYDLVYGSWGNLSVRLNDDEMLITPSGMDYFKIKPEDIVKVNIENLEYGDGRKPSTESILHSYMYRALPGCDAIIHTHSNGCSVFASAKAGFVIEDPELKTLIGDVLVSPYAPSGSKELAVNAAKTLINTHAAILANHGAMFYGPSLDLVLAIANAVEAKACNLLGYNKPDNSEEEEDENEVEA